MTRYYIAARFSEKERMKGVRDLLMALGHTVTSRWIDLEEPESDFNTNDANAIHKQWNCAESDKADIMRADVLLLFTDKESSTGGYYVELGYALGRDKHIVVIGPKKNIFMADPYIRVYPDWPRFVIAISNPHTHPAAVAVLAEEEA